MEKYYLIVPLIRFSLYLMIFITLIRKTRTTRNSDICGCMSPVKEIFSYLLGIWPAVSGNTSSVGKPGKGKVLGGGAMNCKTLQNL